MFLSGFISQIWTLTISMRRSINLIQMLNVRSDRCRVIGIGFMVVMVVAGARIFHAVERRVRMRGTLGQH